MVPVGHELIALRRRNGARLWRHDFESPPVTPVEIGSHVVSGASRPSYGSKPGPLRALRTATGKVIWSGHHPDENSYRPNLAGATRRFVVDEEIELGGASKTTLRGLVGKSGTSKWRRTFNRNYLYERIIQLRSKLEVPAGKAGTSILDIASGKTLFTVRIPKRWIVFDATHAHHHLLLASTDTNAVDVREADGSQILWKTRSLVAAVSRISRDRSATPPSCRSPIGRRKRPASSPLFQAGAASNGRRRSIARSLCDR